MAYQILQLQALFAKAIKCVSILFNDIIQWNVSNPRHQIARDQGNVSDCTGCWNTQVLF